MFINCPNCNALVATDLVTDLPPLQCPRCDFGLRDMQARQVTVPTATDPVAVAPPPLLADPPGLAAPTAPVMPAPMRTKGRWKAIGRSKRSDRDALMLGFSIGRRTAE